MKDIKPAILLFLTFTIICGVIYPLVISGIAQVLFPSQANGSFVTDKSGHIAGSSLIGQPFSDPRYFWPRPSATGDFPYNSMASGGSNAGPTNSDYLKTVADRVKIYRDTGITEQIPTELVQASASGLDPNITPRSAKLQIPRIAKARGIPEHTLTALVATQTIDSQFGFLGAPRVNVLAINLALDKLYP